MRGLYSESDVVGSFQRLEDEEEGHLVSRADKLVEVVTFLKGEKNDRPVTNLEWNPNHRDLFLATYGQPESSWEQTETPGLVHIMST